MDGGQEHHPTHPALREDTGCQSFLPTAPGHHFKSPNKIPGKEEEAFPILMGPCSSCSQSEGRIPAQPHHNQSSDGRLAPGSPQGTAAPSPRTVCALLPPFGEAPRTLQLWLQHPNPGTVTSPGPFTQRSQLHCSVLKGHRSTFQPHTCSQQVNLWSAIRTSCLKVTL